MTSLNKPFRRAAVVLSLLLASSPLSVRADWTVESTSESDHPQAKGLAQSMTLRIKDKNARLDLGNGAVSMVSFGATGKSVMLIHAMKAFQKRTPSEVKEAAEEAKKVAAKDPALVPKDPPKASATGKTAKVNGYDCAEYVAESPGRKQTFWVTKSIENANALNDAVLAAFKSLGGQAAVDQASIPGFPMRIEMEVAAHVKKLPGGQSVDVPATKVVQNFTAIKEGKIDPSVFEIPAGYKEMPAAPAPAGPRP